MIGYESNFYGFLWNREGKFYAKDEYKVQDTEM